MKKNILKTTLLGFFLKDFLQDVDKNRVKNALAKAKKNKPPTPVIDKMKDLNDNIKELEDFLASIP